MASYGEAQHAEAGEDERAIEEQAGVDPREILHAASEIAREHPHAALAGAFAVGFLLGGGLTPRIVASLALFAGRRYLAEAAQGALEAAVKQQIEEASSG